MSQLDGGSPRKPCRILGYLSANLPLAPVNFEATHAIYLA